MEITETHLREWIASSINPYSAFSHPTTIDKSDLEKYLNYLKEAGFVDVKPEDDMFELFTDDLLDDFKNCGGCTLHRLPDLIRLAPIFTEDQMEELINLFAEYMVSELEDFTD